MTISPADQIKSLVQQFAKVIKHKRHDSNKKNTQMDEASEDWPQVMRHGGYILLKQRDIRENEFLLFSFPTCISNESLTKNPLRK